MAETDELEKRLRRLAIASPYLHEHFDRLPESFQAECLQRCAGDVPAQEAIDKLSWIADLDRGARYGLYPEDPERRRKFRLATLVMAMIPGDRIEEFLRRCKQLDLEA